MSPGTWTQRLAVIAGLLFFAAGIVLLWRGIAAHGTVDFSTFLVSGRIESGSAGLFIMFFATVIVVAALRPPRLTAARALPRAGAFTRQIALFLLLTGVAIGSQLYADRLDGTVRSLARLASVPAGVFAFLLLFELFDTAAAPDRGRLPRRLEEDDRRLPPSPE